MLPTLLEDALRKRNLSERQAAKEIGITHSTLSRIIREKNTPDVDTLVRISQWLGVSPAVILGSENATTDETLTRIVQVLRTEPRLIQVFADALSRMAEGNLSMQTFRDIAAYAAFRINQETENVRNTGEPIENEE